LLYFTGIFKNLPGFEFQVSEGRVASILDNSLKGPHRSSLIFSKLKAAGLQLDQAHTASGPFCMFDVLFFLLSLFQLPLPLCWVLVPQVEIFCLGQELDLSGKSIMNVYQGYVVGGTGNNIDIDVNNLNSGVYFLVIESSANQRMLERIVIGR